MNIIFYFLDGWVIKLVHHFCIFYFFENLAKKMFVQVERLFSLIILVFFLCNVIIYSCGTQFFFSLPILIFF